MENDSKGIYQNTTHLLPKLPMFLQQLEDTYFNPQKIDNLFQNYWHYCIYLALFYLAAVFFGTKFMKNRAPLNIRAPLILWNLILALFSICGAYRFLFGFHYLAKVHGIKGTLCATYYYHSTPEGPWVLLFVLSKIPELIDTFFIIARKKKLIFLHWYHHATVLMYSFYLYKDRLAGAAYYGTMNFTVHAIMYSYYFCSACKIRLPKWVSMTVTTLQTLQMFVGVFVTCYLWFKIGDPDCPIHSNNLTAASLMYSTYLFLFAKFFVDTYIFGKKNGQKKSQ